ncbi:hypothetical protein [Lentibacillus cibarius]|uniref:Uncharacterized protein n=1 Tax=Lentibacillus cibarius TaxID=2583219 RepID=A0A5S3QJI8_9BACI|nr:hypothetical protein [Lentibacillus cibarius]TMN21897.1 hypothetical protein FFL34_07050 [Lentibacillus cibarius]
MVKVKIWLKNLRYSVAFLFRPITPVAFSFLFLVLTCIVLVVTIMNMDENLKVYEISLSILTGITASLLIAIMSELYNNYRFNTKRQREIRKYFRCVAGYEIHQSSIMEVNSEYESDVTLGDGRVYATFRQLGEIIPILREALNNRDYLYRTEINEIDDILYNYDEIVKIIWVGLLPEYMSLISQRHDESCDGKAKEDNKCNLEGEGMGDQELIDDESITDYPELYNFLKTEVMYYVEKKYNPDIYDKDPEQLESVIEKAVFYDRHIFNEYFEVTDTRYELVKLIDDEKLSKRGFEFRSYMISKACGNIDKSMLKLQKRATKEPHIWTMAKG